jgi:hypothetical protein
LPDLITPQTVHWRRGRRIRLRIRAIRSLVTLNVEVMDPTLTWLPIREQALRSDPFEVRRTALCGCPALVHLAWRHTYQVVRGLNGERGPLLISPWSWQAADATHIADSALGVAG